MDGHHGHSPENVKANDTGKTELNQDLLQLLTEQIFFVTMLKKFTFFVINTHVCNLHVY